MSVFHTEISLRGTLAARPAVTAVPVGCLYGVTDAGAEGIYRNTGSAWELMGTSTAGAADNAIPKTIVDAKGDLIVATAADTVARVAVGATDAMALMVDSAQSAGIRWASANLYIKEGSGVIYAAYGNGDVNDSSPAIFATSNPDAICTASFNRARGVLFRLPRTLAVTDAYIPGTANGSTGSMYKLCIYKASDNSQIWASAAFDTTANDWTNISSLSFTLDANVDYYLFTLTTASSATNSAACWPAPNPTTLYNSNSPFFASTSQGYPRYVEYTAAVAGTLDATMPALSAISTTTGTGLKVYLKGTGS